ncbi:MAG: hypothetical protein ACM65M_20730 [Microcoleus sp.]
MCDRIYGLGPIAHIPIVCLAILENSLESKNDLQNQFVRSHLLGFCSHHKISNRLILQLA